MSYWWWVEIPPENVEQFADINKLYIVASCWIITATNKTVFRDVCSKVKTKNCYQRNTSTMWRSFNIYVDNKTAVWNCGTFFVCGGDAVNQGPYQKVTPWHAATGTGGWWRCCSDPLAASALEICGWSAPGSGSFIPRKDRCPTYRWLGGPQCRSAQHAKPCPQRDSIPGPSSPQRVAIPTELFTITYAARLKIF